MRFIIVKETIDNPLYYAKQKGLYGWESVPGTYGADALEAEHRLIQRITPSNQQPILTYNEIFVKELEL